MLAATCNGLANDTRLGGQTPHTDLRPGETVFFGPTLLDGFCGNRYTEGAAFSQELDIAISSQTPGEQAVEVTASLAVAVSMGSEFELQGDTPVTVAVSDSQGRPLAADVTIGTDFVFNRSVSRPDTGSATFSVPGNQDYWVRAESAGYKPAFLQLDAAAAEGTHDLALEADGEWQVESHLVKAIAGPTGFFKVSATKNGSRVLMASGMENWPLP